MSYCNGTAAWNQRWRLVRSVWSASVFDTRVVCLMLNAVPPEGGKQIQCDSTVTVELHRLGKKQIKQQDESYNSHNTFSLRGIAECLLTNFAPNCVVINSWKMKGRCSWIIIMKHDMLYMLFETALLHDRCSTGHAGAQFVQNNHVIYDDLCK